MLPIPAATTTLANMQTTSQPMLTAFLPYGYMEIGLILGALAVVFIFVFFKDSISNLLNYFHRPKTIYNEWSQPYVSQYKKTMAGGNKISRFD